MCTPKIEKTTYDLGLAVAANMATCGLSLETQEYYLQNKSLIPEAIRRGFTLSLPEITLTSAPTEIVKDLDWWIAKTEEFSKKLLGVEVNLRDRFAIPKFLWKSAIPVFNPGITNQGAVQKALKDLGLAVWEEVDVAMYSGSEANKGPTLHFIQDSVRPDTDTMGKSPDQLVATGKSWLDLRGYALAFGVYHFATGEKLDPKTFTCFPNNRLTTDKVARGHWRPDRREVSFYWNYSGRQHGDSGSRLAIPATLIF